MSVANLHPHHCVRMLRLVAIGVRIVQGKREPMGARSSSAKIEGRRLHGEGDYLCARSHPGYEISCQGVSC